MPKAHKKPSVLVLGGGVAGAAAADTLGRAGVNVLLVEKERDIGGRTRDMGCKATGVCLRCNVCVADKLFRRVRGSHNARILAGTTLERLAPGVDGSRFSAVLAQANPGGPPARRGAMTVVGADAIVVATGYEPFNPRENNSYGYGRVANVITGLEAEHMLAANRPVARPSDGAVPARAAFVQCVGSRSEEIHRRPEDTDYCSRVCCAYGLRIARKMKHMSGDSKITVFYMDIQNFCKEFDKFYAECAQAVKFVRARPFEVNDGPGGAVRVKYSPPEGGTREEDFDLLVLSIGIRPPPDGRGLANKLGVAMDERGFFGIKGASAFADLQRPGVYAVGTCAGPADIAGCIAQAEALGAAICLELGL